MSETRHYGPGSDPGAENWACLASLIETCKLNRVDPHAYLADVLTKLVNLWPTTRIEELMPWAWAGAQSNSGPTI
jgi:transposase